MGRREGWASNTYAGSYTQPVKLAAGTYTARVGVAKKYRDLFGIADKPATVKVTVQERSWEEGNGAGAARSAAAGEHAGHGTAGEHAGHGTAGGRGAAHQAPAGHAAHAGHGPVKPVQAGAPETSGATPSYNVGHGPLKAAPPALPWALKKRQAELAGARGARRGRGADR